MQAMETAEAENKATIERALPNGYAEIQVGVSAVAFSKLKADLPMCSQYQRKPKPGEEVTVLATERVGSEVGTWQVSNATASTSSTVNAITSSHQMMSKFTLWQLHLALVLRFCQLNTAPSLRNASHRKSRAKLSLSPHVAVVTQGSIACVIFSTFEHLEYRSLSLSEHRTSRGIPVGFSETRSTCLISA